MGDARLGANPFTQDLQYLSSLIGFRKVLRQNEADCTLAARDKAQRILYVLDTNVLLLCFDPIENSDLLKAFPFVDASEEVRRGIAIITANFLLRGDLPGRQRFPVYVSDGHWEEFRNGIRATIDAYNQAKPQMPAKLDSEIRAEIEACRAEMLAAAGSVERLKDITLNRLRPLLLSRDFDAVAKSHVLRGLLRNGRHVRQLHDAPFLRAGALRAVRAEDEEIWRERIRDAYGSLELAERRTQNIKRDAACLAQIETINRQFAEDGIAARAVLVTADHAIQLAAQRHGTGTDDQCVRKVTQYLPIINFRDMSNTVDHHRATSELRMAIDALIEDPDGAAAVEESAEFDHVLEDFDAGLQNFLHILRRLAALSSRDAEWQRRRAVAERLLERLISVKFGRMMDQKLRQTMAEVEVIWTQLLDNSLMVNRALIEEYYASWWSEFVESIEAVSFAEARDLSRLYEAEQIDLSHDLARVHFEQSLISDLASTRSTAERWSRRSVALTLDPPLAQPARQAVEAVRGGAWFETEKAITNLCQMTDVDSADIALGCAVIALQCGRWASARELSQHAITLLTEEADSRRAQPLTLPRAYLVQVMSRRAILLERAPSAEGRGLIAEVRAEVWTCAELCAKAEEAIPPGAGRVERAVARGERCALHAATLMYVLARPTQIEPPADLHDLLAKIAVDAGDVYDLLADASASDFAGGDLVSVVRGRAAAAVLQGLICARHFRRRPPRLLSGFAPEAAATLEEADKRSGPGGFWCQILAIACQLGLAGETAGPTRQAAHELPQGLAGPGPARDLRFALEEEFIRAIAESECLADHVG